MRNIEILNQRPKSMSCEPTFTSKRVEYEHSATHAHRTCARALASSCIGDDICKKYIRKKAISYTSLIKNKNINPESYLPISSSFSPSLELIWSILAPLFKAVMM